jgi:gluconolactonase
MKQKKILLILLSFGFIGLHAQDTITNVIPIGASIKKLSSNQFIFTEGPVWYRDSVLLFTNEGPIICYDPAENKFRNWPNKSAWCNGLTCDKAGNLLACSTNIIMMNKTGQVIKTLASGFNGKPFNNPNDLIADDKGGVYFTDPAYFVANPPQDKKAVYYIDSTGNVKRIIDEFTTPNGIILSPDGKKLYLEVPDSTYLYSWDVASDGSVSGKLNFALLQTNGGLASGADGIAIDINGNIYVASEKGIQIFSPQGAAITTIEVPEIPSNCDFGGKDFKTLYITARKNLYSIDLNYPGYAVSGSNFLPDAIPSISDKPLVEIYPNPVQNVLHINLTGKAGTLEAFDISGKSVLQNEIHENNSSIDVSGLENGIYFVKVSSDNQLFTGKFVKH